MALSRFERCQFVKILEILGLQGGIADGLEPTFEGQPMQRGTHLRWGFAPELGFPPNAFWLCVRTRYPGDEFGGGGGGGGGGTQREGRAEGGGGEAGLDVGDWAVAGVRPGQGKAADGVGKNSPGFAPHAVSAGESYPGPAEPVRSTAACI